jgi:hypothetical protein
MCTSNPLTAILANGPSTFAEQTYTFFHSYMSTEGMWAAGSRYLFDSELLYRMILVDSTRSGKSMPDALSKTVPLWCAVINECLRSQGNLPNEAWEKNGQLSTPPKTVSNSEKDQMEKLIQPLSKALSVSNRHEGLYQILTRCRNPLSLLQVSINHSSHFGLHPSLPSRYLTSTSRSFR